MIATRWVTFIPLKAWHALIVLWIIVCFVSYLLWLLLTKTFCHITMLEYEYNFSFYGVCHAVNGMKVTQGWLWCNVNSSFDFWLGSVSLCPESYHCEFMHLICVCTEVNGETLQVHWVIYTHALYHKLCENPYQILYVTYYMRMCNGFVWWY